METKLDQLLGDIGGGIDFDLDEFIAARVDRLSKEPPRDYFFDDCYRRGLLDGVLLRHIYGQARGI